jgi:peptidoglycan/LPS O-acetylase OafA/YrhL
MNKTRTLLTSLTSLRFFAALCVVVHHAAAISGNISLVSLLERLGWLGVSFFFILSGFVLVWSFDESVHPTTYILRRLTRIYPLHFVCLCASLAYFVYTGSALGGYVGTDLGTVANFLLIQDWIPGHPNIRQAWNGVSWTLSCEFFFYLLAPICFPVFLKIDRFKYIEWVVFIWLVLVAFSVVAQAKSWNAVLDFYLYHPLPRAMEFFLGALGARWMKAGFRFKSVIASLFLMIMPVLIYCACVTETLECPMLMNLLFIPGAFLLILSTAGREYDGRKSWLQRDFFVRLGDASFALYMTHALLLGLYARLIRCYFKNYFYSSLSREVALTLLYLVAATVLSLVVHLFFEVPARKNFLHVLSRGRRNIPSPEQA